jgi:hypothetical protein
MHEMSRRDRLAVEAYENHCKTLGLPITEDGRKEWVREWRNLDEEARWDAVEAERDQVLERPQARNDNPASEVNPVFEFPDVGRHAQTGDGEKLWILARGSIGQSEQGFHSRIEILHDYEPFNIAGFWDNPRTEEVAMDGIPQGWSAPFGTYEEASWDAKKSLVEFDRRTAQSLGQGLTLAGSGSYARVNRILAESAEFLESHQLPEAHGPETERERESGIKEVSRSNWQMQDDGLTEQFVAVGRGNEGFHYAVFTSYRGGDDYRWSEGPPWSEQAFPTQDAAREAAHVEMRHADYENSYEPKEPDWPEAREESAREPHESDIDLDR